MTYNSACEVENYGQSVKDDRDEREYGGGHEGRRECQNRGQKSPYTDENVVATAPKPSGKSTVTGIHVRVFYVYGIAEVGVFLEGIRQACGQADNDDGGDELLIAN